MKQIKNKKEKGVTLIALVVTIIVLIVLAGISINLIFGNLGIVTKAKEARTQMEEAQIKEDIQLKLADLQAKKEITGEKIKASDVENVILGAGGKVVKNSSGEITGVKIGKKTIPIEEIAKGIIESLPENTKENPQKAGTEVKMPEKWIVSTPNNVTSVRAIATGDGDTIPVPKGFYYVGGNLNTGVIISDEKDDEYDEKIDKTTYEYTTNLKGNQFVWIPCEVNNYRKTDWGVKNADYDTTTPDSELKKIEKYEGFYVGRYEAGLASEIKESTKQEKSTGTNSVYNLDGIPQSKAGLIPWMFINLTYAKQNSESMYDNDKYKNYVSSALITGTQWDVILNTLINRTTLTSADMKNSINWGNFSNNSLLYKGRKAKADWCKTNSMLWTLMPFEAEKTGTKTKYNDNEPDRELLTTGASSKTEKYHIFDIAGNLWELTDETSYYENNGQYCVVRGGAFNDPSTVCCASHRIGTFNKKETDFSTGFRTVLYIK